MDVTPRIATLELAETFVIARDARDTAEVVQVELSYDGTTGFGEAAPIDRYNERRCWTLTLPCNRKRGKRQGISAVEEGALASPANFNAEAPRRRE